MDPAGNNHRGREPETRRYRILDVVGEGGFGKVYRARLEGPTGFQKDVAVKLLTEEDAPDGSVERFRDESRILGLVRDRAVVGVDPPTRLDGRWAVVMEFIDGVNVATLLRNGPVPPRVAISIVQEVCRALDNVYQQAGPSGAPLKLLHRDLKPANLQITPSGTVKILDFGIARAEFEERESKTTANISGTFGYIAPERILGEDGPAGDVFSMGVVLLEMLTAKRRKILNPSWLEDHCARHPELEAPVVLAQQMIENSPEDRPTARDVEQRCERLYGAMSGPSLRDWAEGAVPAAQVESAGDDLIGAVLTETLASVPTMGSMPLEPTIITQRERGPWVALGVTSAVLVVVSCLGLLGTGTGVYVSWRPRDLMAPPPVPKIITVTKPAPLVVPTPPQPEPAVVPDPRPVRPQPGPVAPVRPADPVPVAQPEPLAEPAPQPVAEPAPQPVAQPEPAPQPVAEPAPVPQPEVAVVTMRLSSIPPGAKLSIDGVPHGTTPKAAIDLPIGRHTVVMDLDGKVSQRAITVSRSGNKKHIWYADADEWKAFSQ